MAKIKLTTNPIFFGRVFSAMIIVISIVFALLIYLNSAVNSGGIWIKFLQFGFPICTIFIQVYAWYMQVSGTEKIENLPAVIYATYGIALAILSFVFKTEPSGVFFIGIGLFSLVSFFILVSSRNIETIEKIRPGWYEVTYRRRSPNGKA